MTKATKGQHVTAAAMTISLLMVISGLICWFVYAPLSLGGVILAVLASLGVRAIYLSALEAVKEEDDRRSQEY